MLGTAWENNIYSQGKHINRDPYGELVSFFYNSLCFIKNNDRSRKLRVLELGCRAGNNLWFFAENGFEVHGIDASETACQLAQSLAEKNAS